MNWMPEPLLSLDTEAFRRELVGDTPARGRVVESPISKQSAKEEAINAVVLLADLYGGADRVKIWEHIAKALQTAGAAVEPDDFSGFFCACLPEIQADVTRAACNEKFQAMLESMESRPPEYREYLIRYLTGPTMAVAIGFGRKKRQQNKEGE